MALEISRRNKIIIAVIVIGAVFLIAILWLTQSDKSMPPPPDSQPPQTFERLTPTTDFGVELGSGAVVQPEQVASGSSLLAVARTFSERFGSYSNQSNFENLKDVQAFMTPRFIAETQNLIDQMVQTQQTEIYQGVTTKVTSPKIISLDDSAAQVMVSVQRKNAQGSTENYQLAYQNLLLEMVKAGDKWLVDQAIWQ